MRRLLGVKWLREMRRSIEILRMHVMRMLQMFEQDLSERMDLQSSVMWKFIYNLSMSQSLLRVICNLFFVIFMQETRGKKGEMMLESHVKSCLLQSRCVATQELGGSCA